MEPEDVLDILASSPDGVYGVDADQKVFLWNQAARRILGWEPEEVLGRRCYEVLAGPRSGAANPALCAKDCPSIQWARRGRTPQSQRLPARAKDGSFLWLTVTHVLVPSAVGGADALVHIFHRVENDKGGNTVRELVSAVDHSAQARPALLEIDEVLLAPLTGREQEILQLMSQGLGTQELAKRLVVAVPTVRNHIQRILGKLGVHTRLEAVALASRKGLL